MPNLTTKDVVASLIKWVGFTVILENPYLNVKDTMVPSHFEITYYCDKNLFKDEDQCKLQGQCSDKWTTNYNRVYSGDA